MRGSIYERGRCCSMHVSALHRCEINNTLDSFRIFRAASNYQDLVFSELSYVVPYPFFCCHVRLLSENCFDETVFNLQVLDMCAAPGSKTFQMLEMLHSGSTPATGLVVANDADAKRCNLLAHQTKRMCSPSMLVSNHEGQVRFPFHVTTRFGVLIMLASSFCLCYFMFVF